MSVWAIYLEYESIDNVVPFTIKNGMFKPEGDVSIFSSSDDIKKYKESSKDPNENCYLYAEDRIKHEMHTDDLVWVGDSNGKYALGRVTKDYPCNMPEKFSMEDFLRTPGYDWHEIDSENALPKEIIGSPIIIPITVIPIKEQAKKKKKKMAYNQKSSSYKYNVDEPSDEDEEDFDLED
jgi:hypothetical protein